MKKLIAACFAATMICNWCVAPAVAQQNLLPLTSYTVRTDSKGFRWDCNYYGYVSKGSNNTFSTAGYMTINGASFRSQQRMRSADGKEWFLSGPARNISTLHVTRRIRVDPVKLGIRYVEIFENRSSQNVSISVAIRSTLGRTNSPRIVTQSGQPLGRFLGKSDSGIVAQGAPRAAQNTVVFYLGGSRSKIKPAISNSNNRTLTFTYAVPIKAGRKVALIHGMAQQSPSVATATAAKLLREFGSRRYRRDLPRTVTSVLVNARGGFGAGIASLASIDSLGVTPGASDTLAMGENTRLYGTANCKEVRITTRFGVLKVPFERVLALVGDRHAGGAKGVFLRDGQVFTGRVEIAKLTFTLNSGLELPLTSDKLDRLVGRSRPDDGKSGEDTFAIVDTMKGDRLAVVRSEVKSFAATTPWGDRTFSIGQLSRLEVAEDGYGHFVQLRDGSRFFAFVDDSSLVIKTRDFGSKKLFARDVRAITAAQSSPDADANEDLTEPNIQLVGNNVLVGRVDMPRLNFYASGQKVPVPPGQVRTLTINDGGASVEAELWDGSSITGVLKDTILPVRAAGRVFRVPLRDIVEINVPVPTVPDSLRRKITEHIRDLGDKDFNKRELATKALAQLGQLSKGQLAEAVGQTNDAEVRRRIEKLLEELK